MSRSAAKALKIPESSAFELFGPDEIAGALRRMLSMADAIIPTELDRSLASEWANERRVLPQGLSPYPGPFNIHVTPYIKEILDNLSESVPVHETAVMKGTQIAYTVGVIENWIGYTIDRAPGPMLYLTGDAQMAEAQMELRIDALINSAGIGHRIASQHKRLTQRKSGDLKTRKEFYGGLLMAVGPNSGPKLRSMSFQKGAADEIDAYPDSTGKEGDVISLFRRRFDAFLETYKILWGSTPLLDHNSKIKRLYVQGDQRKYFVPCKHCGHMQFLKWSQLKWETTDAGELACTRDSYGRIVDSTVYYECESCKGRWKNDDKTWFMDLSRAEWRPTTHAVRQGMRSYHIPGLYSPVGFRSWEDAVNEYLILKNQGFPKLEYQNFVNTFLAETWVEKGERPKIEVVLSTKRSYRAGTLPEDADPIFVTLAADVQADRIEYEVVAWGENAVSWSVDYRVIQGDTEDPESPVWQKLRSAILSEYAGFAPLVSAVDAGYRTSTVYAFCSSFDGPAVVAVMGDSTHSGVRKSGYFAYANVAGSDLVRVDFNTDLLKQQFYEYLNKGKYEDGRYPMGYCHFPVDYDREHYKRLTNESRIMTERPDGGKKWEWKKTGRQEQLDCRVYNLGLLHVLKDHYKTEVLQVEELAWAEFWTLMREERSAQLEEIAESTKS